VATVLVLAVVAPAWSAPVAAQPAAPRSLDLAALVLTPADIGEAGFVHDGAFVQPLGEWAENLAAYRGSRPADVEQELTADGWVGKYVSTERQPTAGNPALFVAAVSTSITEFRDAAGAARAFAFTEDESGVASARDLPMARTIGDRSEVTLDSGVSGVSGQRFVSLDLAFQFGKYTAGVPLYRYERLGAAAATPAATPVAGPDVATVERLAAIVADRLADPGELPGLSLHIQRLGGDDRNYTTYDDAYYRLAGRDVPLLGEQASGATARTASYGRATSVYQLWQGVDAASADGLLYAATLFRFATPEDAAAWVGDAPRELAQNPAYRGLTPLADGPEVGDRSATFSFRPGGPDSPVAGTMLVAQVGDTVLRVQLAPMGTRDMETRAAVESLARQQAGCLSEACPAMALPGA
jgi:hypothetical protein